MSNLFADAGEAGRRLPSDVLAAIQKASTPDLLDARAVLKGEAEPDILKYREDQSRDDHGRFAYEGAGGTGVGPKLDTMGKYYQNGKWDANRVATVHEPMMRIMQEGVPTADGKPTLYMTGGGYGSGKSTLLDKFPGVVGFPTVAKGDALAGAFRAATDPTMSATQAGPFQNGEAVRADPDALKSGIPEYQKLAGGDPPDPSAATYVHEESSELAKDAVKEGLGSGKDVVYDTSADTNPDKLASKVDGFRQAGAGRVICNYAFSGSIEESQARADARAAASGGLRRFVDPGVLAANAHEVANCWFSSAERGTFDSLGLWSTAGKFGDPPTQIAHAEGGQITVVDPVMFAKFQALR